MAIAISKQSFQLREILLKEKPAQMLDASPKGTVPVAVFDNGMVIEESLELMLWALSDSDGETESWLDDLDTSLAIIHQNDNSFKPWLDRYKYHVGYPEQSQAYYQDRCGEFLEVLESRLSGHQFLLGEEQRLADIAVFPFVRQFAFVDRQSFDQSGFRELQRWFSYWLTSGLFNSIMHKYPPWHDRQEKVLFPIN